MGVIGSNVLTLADWAKVKDPDGKVATIVEMLSQTNDLLEDMVYKEGNTETGERTTIRTGLPTVYWRMLNMGVPSSKSRSAQVDENCGMLEAWSEVDKDLAMLNGNTASFRLAEAQAFIEAMNQEMAATVIYGNAAVNPEEFTGLAPRYSSLAAVNGQNIISGGGAGADNTSIWLVVWGTQTVFGVFPKGSKAGLMHEDLGEQTIETTAGMGGSRLRAYQDRFQWKNGLVVKDWRYVVRIANIDVSNLALNDNSSAKLTQLMIKAIHRIPNIKFGKPAFYMNRSVAEFLDIQRLDAVKGGGGLTYENMDGKQVMTFRGIPIRIVDSILETEQAVS